MIKWVTKCDVFRTVVSSQCWSWNSSTVATWCEELLIRKDLDAGTDWRQEEKGMTEDEMVGWHHQLNGHEFEQTPGVGDGQGRLACCRPWSHKESDRTEQLNWSSQLVLFLLWVSIGKKKKHILRVVSQTLFGTKWGHSLRDSTSDNSEELLRRGKGKVSVIHDFSEGGHLQSNIHFGRSLLLVTRSRCH